MALRGLSDAERRTLHVISGFRMPAGIETLEALLVRGEDDASDEVATGTKPFATLVELDATLGVLEDRGLLGWDRRANRYDLHPIVRGVTWSGLGEDARVDVYDALRVHFEAMPTIDDWEKVESLDDLTPAIELYNTLIGLSRYEEAFEVFRDRLGKAMLYRLSANHQRVEMLERLFPDGLGKLPRLLSVKSQAFTLNTLALGYQFSGRPGSAVALFQVADKLDVGANDVRGRSVGLSNLSDALCRSGALYSAESSARSALTLARELSDRHQEAVHLQRCGLALAVRGLTDRAHDSLRRSLRIFFAQGNLQGEGTVSAYLGELACWRGSSIAAHSLADRAWELAAVYRLERDFIRAARLQGAAALLTGDLAITDEWLHHAVRRVRACQLVEEELPILIALAELHRRQGRPKQARELLDDLWDPAERGPYPLLHADAFNVLAQIERDAGNTDAAVDAARRAYELAWCDGPPFAFHWGLEKARAYLAELGAEEPQLEPFDESKFEPMPEVEIDPPDDPIDPPDDTIDPLER